MQPQTEFNQIRDLDEVVSDSIIFFKRNFKSLAKAYFTICGFFLAASVIIGIINFFEVRVHQEEGTSIFTVTYFLALLFGLFNTTITVTTILAYLAVYRDKGNIEPEVAEVWSYVKFYVLRMVGSVIVIAVIMVAGFAFCLLPGIYFVPVLSLILPIIVMENATFGHAFNRCFKLIKNRWWQVFGSMILISIVLWAATLAFMVPCTIFAEIYALISGTSLVSIIQLPVLVASACAHFLYAIPVIGLTLNYFSLAEQKEGASLLQRIEMLGNREQQANPSEGEEY